MSPMNHNGTRLTLPERVRLAQLASDDQARERMGQRADRLQRSLERAEAVFSRNISEVVDLDRQPRSEAYERRMHWASFLILAGTIIGLVGLMIALR